MVCSMMDVWAELPNRERLLLKYSMWSGNLRVYWRGYEMANLGLTGGIATFNVGMTRVEIESRLTVWGTCEVTIRADGYIIFRRRFL